MDTSPGMILLIKTINPHDLCYQCSKHYPEFLFRKLRIRDCKDKPCSPARRKLLSCKTKMKTIFKKQNGTIKIK